MVINRLAKLAVLLTLMACASAVALADKPPKIPVAFGNWKGPQANIFKNAVRRGVSKECTTVKPKAARVLIEGEVTEQDKKFVVRVIVRTPNSSADELVGSHEYTYAKPKLSQGQANKIGHDVIEMARRAPGS